MSGVFFRNDACPFCRSIGRERFQLRYAETAEANPAVPDVQGQILACEACGICYPSHDYDREQFAALYAKSLGDLIYFDHTILQRLRRRALVALGSIPAARRGFLALALQIPIDDHRLPGQRVLDVGAGLGEFSAVYRQLGAIVTATEVIPQLAEQIRRAGIACHLGELESLSFPDGSFDLILFRAVLYRTRNPARTLDIAKRLLAPGGRISVIDPCTDEAGVGYFARKQFPQGRYYITNRAAFADMLERHFGLSMVAFRAIYGRPRAPLAKVRFIGNVTGFAELLWNNLVARKPYVLAYLLKQSSPLLIPPAPLRPRRKDTWQVRGGSRPLRPEP